MAGKEQTFEVEVNNLSTEAVVSGTLKFDITGGTKIVGARLAGRDCVRNQCPFTDLAGHGSLSGHVTVLPVPGFQTRLTMSANLKWFREITGRGESTAEATGQLVDSGRAGDLVWISHPATEGSIGINCSDDARRVQLGSQTVYVIFAGDIHAFSRSKGELLWHEKFDEWGWHLVLANGSLFHYRQSYGSDREPIDYLRALDASTGRLLWEIQLREYPTGPVLVAENSIYLIVLELTPDNAISSNSLLSLDAATGALNWSYQVDEWLSGSPFALDSRIHVATANAGPNYIYAFHPQSGEVEDIYEMPSESVDTPSVRDGNVYTVSVTGTIYSVDLLEERENWQYDLAGITYLTPVSSGGSLYSLVFDETDADYYSADAIDAATGTFKWRYEPGRDLTFLAASEGSVLVSSWDDLVSLDSRSGESNWEGKYGYICERPIISEGIIYGQASLDGTPFVFAIRAR